MILIAVLIVAQLGRGASNFDKIVNGRDAEEGEFPYQVQISRGNDMPFCGGAIIDLHHVITAGSCIGIGTDSFLPPQTIIAGVYYEYDFDNSNRVDLHYDEVYMHENYSEADDRLYNDIAIIRVKNGFKEFTKFIQPVALATDEINEGMCYITGWGVTSVTEEKKRGKGSHGIPLQVAKVPIFDFNTCTDMMHGSKRGITPGMLCAGSIEGAHPCSGDGGGPLVCNGKLVGITSWEFGCYRPKQLGLYSNVTFYKSWIHKTLKRSWMEVLNKVSDKLVRNVLQEYSQRI